MDTEERIKIATLYRYYLYAVVMRENFKNQKIEDFINKLDNHPTSVLLFFSSEAGIYMTYLYSAIYLVIEGWKDLKLSDEKINELINSPNTDKLMLLRNDTFHYQKEPLSTKLIQFFGSEEEATEKWINELYGEFGRFFKENSFGIPEELKEELKGKDKQDMAVFIQKYFLKGDLDSLTKKYSTK